jgi:hypothetical protein
MPARFRDCRKQTKDNEADKKRIDDFSLIFNYRHREMAAMLGDWW